MKIYLFTSQNLTNIWIGIKAHQWAVSTQQGENLSIQTKARNLPIGALGLFYCVETKSLTTPFTIQTKPKFDLVVEDIWPGKWLLPFSIVNSGTPDRQIHKDKLGKLLPTLVNTKQRWDQIFHVSPITVFAPSEIAEGDWSILADALSEKIN